MSRSELVKECVAAFDRVLSSKNIKEASKAYDNWAEKFDKHSVASGFVEVPKSVARLCGKYVRNSKETTLLDVGAGTARVAEYLRTAENFKGVIDILDGSIDMLYIASKKDLGCRCIIQHLVEGDIPLPEHSYDVVVSAGAFLPNHLPVQSLEACLKLIKPNGFFIVTNEPTSSSKAYCDEFKTMLSNLVHLKRIVLLESFEITSPPDYIYDVKVIKRCADK